MSGSDVPDAVGSFQDLCSSYSLPQYIMKNIVAMGYAEPTPIQMQAIPLMLQVCTNCIEYMLYCLYNKERKDVAALLVACAI